MPVLCSRVGRFLSISFLACLIFSCASTVAAQAAPASQRQSQPLPPPTPEQVAIQAAAQKEHQREMDLLGIKQLRRGADGDPKSPHAANYDESRADVYPSLPDPLLLKNRTRVTSAAVWWSKRRPEIAEEFDREILGRTPPVTPKVTWEIISTKDEKNGDIPVVTKELIGHVDNSADPSIQVNIELTLSTPANAAGPVPVILELGFSKEFMEQLRKRFPQFAALMANQGPGNTGKTWQQLALAEGWGYAEYVPTSVQADNGGQLDQGIIGLVNKGQPRKLDDWGALKAWAWGASRCLDYFETDKAVDAKQVGVEGHSRYGKATLVIMAYDPRFAIAFVSSSGEGGAKLYRHIFGEQVGNIAGDEFYWMAGNFMKYAGPLTPGDMPVDNHELIAMCAPRPVFVSGGAVNGDGWVDAKGMFLAAAGAGPVYKLLGKRDMGTTSFPPIETGLMDGDIAFRQHAGGHTPAPNWPTFIRFASRYLRAPGAPPAAAATPAAPSAPMHITAEQDRKRLLDLLGINDADLRPQPSPDAKSANGTNYDESKANVYRSLPDPLKLKSGEPVAMPAQWWSVRRPEIVADFNHEILGNQPPDMPRVTWSVVNSTSETIAGAPVATRRLAGKVDNSIDPAISVTIDAVLITPAHSPGPVPVIVSLAFPADFKSSLARPLTDAGSGDPGDYGQGWIGQVLARGWGVAVLSPNSWQLDSGDGLTEGIIGLMNKGQPRGLDDWGALRAWAWGASRFLDYLETDKSVDAKQVGIFGHSRFGKAALVTMAYDERFAIVFSSSSGEGGAKLYRHIYGEQMPNIASASLYHWMAGNFLRYGGPKTPADLPVDNHELIALCAPRPVFLGSGGNGGDGYANPHGDGWADPRGMFLAEVAAGPVYKLLGKQDLGTAEIPPVETAVTSGDLAFRQHNLGHTPAPNWPAFLQFASRYLHAPTSH